MNSMDLAMYTVVVTAINHFHNYTSKYIFVALDTSFYSYFNVLGYQMLSYNHFWVSLVTVTYEQINLLTVFIMSIKHSYIEYS